MKKILKFWSIAIFSLFFTMGMTACNFGGSSGSGGGGSGDTSSDTTTTTYTGDLTLSGSIDTSSLSSSDTSALRSRSVFSRAGETEVVKLYVLDENGDMKDTGISCTVDLTGTYTCDGIKGSEEYIVRYMRDLGNGQVLELKSTATVGTTNPDPVTIDPITTMIVEAVVEAVTEAISGLTSDEDLVASIISSVKTSITTVMTTMVQNGTIQIPSMIVETTDDFDTFVGNQEVASNENIASASGAVLTDDTVNNAVLASKTEAKGDVFANMTEAEIIEDIFNQMMSGNGGGAPQWMMNFLADHYNDGSTFTVGSLQDGLSNNTSGAGYDDQGGWNPDTYLVDEFERIGIASGDIQGVVDAAITAIKNGIDNGTALAMAKEGILAYHEIKAKSPAERTDAEIQQLAEFPAIVGELFPVTFVTSMDTSTEFQNVGQITAYTIFILDIYSNQVAKEAILAQLGGSYAYGDQLEQLHIVENEPFFLFEELGLNETTINDYAGVSVGTYFEAKMDLNWDNSTNTEIQYLNLEGNLENALWMMGGAYEAIKLDNATLTYPTATGTATYDLTVTDMGGYVKYSTSSWNCNSDYSVCSYDSTKAITDNVTGDYTVSITYDGTIVSKTFSGVFIISDASAYAPKLTSPKAYPQWPGSNANSTELAAFEAEQIAFWEDGITTFAPNNSDNTTLEEAVFKWEAADLSGLDLPDNIKARYQVSISLFNADADGDGNVTDSERDDCNENWESCNTDIYNTWWSGRAIKGTSLTLPFELAQNVGESEYSIGVNLVFIDKDTGNQVANGGYSYANFKVGASTALNGDEVVSFTGTVSVDGDGSLPANLKVALLAESNTYSSGTWNYTSKTIGYGTVAGNGTYTVSATVDTLKANTGDNKWINLIAFVDADSDNSWDSWSETDSGELVWWMRNTWMWIENWGDFRISVDGDDREYTSQKIKQSTNATISNMNFEIEVQ